MLDDSFSCRQEQEHWSVLTDWPMSGTSWRDKPPPDLTHMPCLSPTSQPLINAAISILAFQLFVLFPRVSHVVRGAKVCDQALPTQRVGGLVLVALVRGCGVGNVTNSKKERGVGRGDILDVKNILSGYSQHAGCPFRGVKSSLFTDLITDSGISLAGIYHKAPLSLYLMESAPCSLPGLL